MGGRDPARGLGAGWGGVNVGLIARAGKPVVRLVPVANAAPRQPGMLKGLSLPDDLFDPLPEDELALWE